MHAKLKYNLNNLPSVNEQSSIIEENFLRHLENEHLPDLGKYLEKLNSYDWTRLLAHNPRKEFIDYISDKMINELDWTYILSYLLDDIKQKKYNKH